MPRTGSVLFASCEEEARAPSSNVPIVENSRALLDYESDDIDEAGEDDPVEPNEDLQNRLDMALQGHNLASGHFTPATQEPYYRGRHDLQGPIIFHAAELCEDCLEDDPEGHLSKFEILLKALDVKEVSSFVASYFYFGQNVIHLMHFAASIGSVPLMEKIKAKFGPEVVNVKSRIVDRDKNNLRPTLSEKAGKVTRSFSEAAKYYAKQWSCSSTSQEDEANSPLLPRSPPQTPREEAVRIWKAPASGMNQPHYPPLLAAMYMSRTEAIMWLIHEGADVTAANMTDFTALHILAQNGVPYEDPERADESLSKIVKTLLRHRANLDAKSNDRHPRKALKLKTPLEIACNKSFGYPKHMLHLLMQSYQCPERSKPFAEVWNIAQIDPGAAERLTNEMKYSKISKWRHKVLNRMLREIHEVPDSSGREPSATTPDQLRDFDRSDHIVNRLCDILKRAPNAAADILDCLTQEPRVQDRQKNPLPNFAKLSNHIMEASYQPDVASRRSGGIHLPSWDDKKEKISWQSLFKSELPSNPYLHADIYPVKVRAVLFPNWLRVRMLHVLVLLGEHSDQMEIFGRLPVQAAITCLWLRVVAPAHLFNIVWQMVLISSLVFLGTVSDKHEVEFMWYASASMCFSCVLKESFFIIWEIFTYRTKTREPYLYGAVRTYLFNFALNQHGGTALLIFFAVYLFDENQDLVVRYEPKVKVLLAVNLFWRFLNVLMMFRAWRGIGEIILAVMLSFIPLRYMLVLIASMFFVFSVVFVTLNEGVVEPQGVLRWLYIALFFGEGDGIEDISGFGSGWLDDAKDQGHWLQAGSILFMVLGGVIFSVILLNLIIAMYSNYYEEMVPMANLHFHKNRAHTMVRALLQPGFPRWLLRRAIPNSHHRHAQILAAGVSICCFLLFWVLIFFRLVRFSAVALAFSGWLCQAALRQAYWKHNRPAPHYLWVCYRDDFHETVNRPRVKVLHQVHRTVENLEKDMASLQQSMKTMAANLEFCMKKLNIPLPMMSRVNSTDALDQNATRRKSS